MNTTQGDVTIRQSAPAKLNLYLHVTGQRNDGYHELDSLVVFADIADQIEISQNDDLSLTVSGPFGAELSTGDDNLVLRAAHALAEHAGVRAHAHLHLTKNLPVASGIGGGSADAAATLKALSAFWKLTLDDDDIHYVANDVSDNRDTARALSTLFKLWRDDLSNDLLARIGLGLGADVPACLEGRSVFMGGIGERLDLAPYLPPVWFVLVNPGVSVSTPTIFKARQGPFTQPARFHDNIHDAKHLAEVLKQRNNDLTPPAIVIAPVIADVLSALDQQPNTLLSRMSGSGATCFGLYETDQQARQAAQNIAREHPDWWSISAPLLDLPIEY